MSKSAYTVNELTREIGVSRSKLYQEIAEGKITPRKLGKKTIFLRSDVEAYLSNLPTSNKVS